ncbi:MAG: hypothetical protein AAF430_18470 [Myxococcota bacterium]
MGNRSPATQPAEKRFYWSLPALAGLSVVSGLIAAVAFWLGLDQEQAAKYRLEAMLFPFLVAVPLFLILSLGRHLKPVIVTETGLRWSTDGPWHEVGWQAIRSATRFNLLGLRYARLSSSDHRSTLFLPLFLSGSSEFSLHVAQVAGHDHCLSRLLAGQTARRSVDPQPADTRTHVPKAHRTTSRSEGDRPEMPGAYQLLALPVFFGGLTAMTESLVDALDNTLGGLRLFWVGAALGITSLVLLNLALSSSSSVHGARWRVPVPAAFLFLVGSALAGAALLSSINTNGPQGPIVTHQVPAISKQAFGAGNTTYYVFVDWHGRSERLKVQMLDFRCIREGSTLELDLSPGALGFPYPPALIDGRRFTTSC